jgi:hypothetical protein
MPDHDDLIARLRVRLRPLLIAYGRVWEKQATYLADPDFGHSGSPMEALEDEVFNVEKPIIDVVAAALAEAQAQLRQMREERDEARALAGKFAYMDVHAVNEAHAAGYREALEAAAKVAERKWQRGSAHTYASENADRYIALEDASEAIAAAIRALPVPGATT